MCWTCSLEVNICPHGILHSLPNFTSLFRVPSRSLSRHSKAMKLLNHVAFEGRVAQRISLTQIQWFYEHWEVHVYVQIHATANTQLHCIHSCTLDGYMDTSWVHSREPITLGSAWVYCTSKNLFDLEHAMGPWVSHDRREANLARLAHQARPISSPVHLIYAVFGSKSDNWHGIICSSRSSLIKHNPPQTSCA